MSRLSSFRESPVWKDRHFIVLFQLTVILLTGTAAYVNSLNGPFHFDDLGITDTRYLWPRAFASGPRQLVDLTFVANHLWNAESLFGFHIVNLVVHLAAAAALYFLAGAMLAVLVRPEEPGAGSADTPGLQFIRRFIPFATALLFVCHPVHTQAVSYIVQRYASMVALFYICSVLAFIHARRAAVISGSRASIMTASVLSLLAGILALRCKETAYTLPVMLVVVEVFLFNGRLLRNRVFIISMGALLLAIPVARVVQHGSGGLQDLIFNIQHSTKEELTYSRTDYLMTQFRVVVSYLRLLVLPVDLNLDHDIPLQKSFFALPVLSSLLLHISLFAGAALLFLRSGRILSIQPGSHQGICLRLMSLGIVWFYVALALESSIIPILDVMFEHRLYLPSAGGLLTLTSACALLAAAGRSARTAAWGVLLSVSLIFTIATIQRNRVWNDDLLLWEDTASKSPNKPRVLANLSAAYIRTGQPARALPILIRTLELSPGFTDALNNLGTALELIGGFEGRLDSGRRYLTGTRTVDMRFFNIWFANTRNNLGLAYESRGNLLKAGQFFESAVTLEPTFALAWYNLYLTALRQGDRRLADEALNRLNSLSPDLAGAARRITPTVPGRPAPP